MGRLVAALGGTAAVGLGWGLFEAGWLRLRTVQVDVAGLPPELDGLRIAHLSDFHLGMPSRGERASERAAGWVAARSPDLTCVTGDLLARPRGEPLLRRIVEQLPSCYAVLGNHDYADTRDPFARDARVTDLAPATLLRDESRTLELRGRRVQLVGVDPRSYRARTARPDRFADPSADLRILLCHFPPVVRKLLPGTFHVVLAGHMHDGQIVLPYPGGKVRFAHPSARLTHGLYRFGDTVLHVSPGLGTTFVPFRFFARPEATELVLRRAEARAGQVAAAARSMLRARVSTRKTGGPGTPPGLERELAAVKRFPEGNPNPVLQIGTDAVLLYANPASAGILNSLGLVVGGELSEELARELRDALRLVPSGAVEVQASGRTYSILPVEAPELGVVNLYATDVTAAHVLERFPDSNPNPVLRISREGAVLYRNDASLPITEALGVDVGERLPQDAVDHVLASVDGTESRPLELQSRGRHYELHPRLIPELGTINVYGTDITARRAMDKFPDENPNPVLRITRDGRLQYANPAAEPLAAALGVGVEESLPEDFLRRVEAIAAQGSEERVELRADGRIYELRVVSVYEFDFVNLYATDVTAARAVEQASRENERLLLAILPPSVAERLRSGEQTIADDFEDMTVLFADLVGFTELSSRLPAAEVVRMLNEVVSAFDELADRHGLEKIKTIGDAYMAVGGLSPHPAGRDHAAGVADTALAMLDAVERLATATRYGLQVRIGLHAGPTVAGVIGMRKFIYDVWGDAVNKASRMESYGVPGRIQVTEETYRRLRGSFEFERRGTIEVKGLGAVTTYFLGLRKR